VVAIAKPHLVSNFESVLLVGAVLRNLVNNAVKYTQPGGRILVGCRRSGSDIRIDVYDTGIGIPDEQMPKIFEAFARLNNARRDGLGIGLSSCGRQSRFWGTASTSPPFLAAGPVFPFVPQSRLERSGDPNDRGHST
jgi:K+-sensing histidine kinase KdpD